MRATFMVNRMAARQLRDGGAIVNVLSSVDESAFPVYGGCATMTAAVEALTRVLASELRGREVTVNGVSVDADKTCTPGRVAEIVAYLLGDEGRRITGRVIHLDDR